MRSKSKRANWHDHEMAPQAPQIKQVSPTGIPGASDAERLLYLEIVSPADRPPSPAGPSATVIMRRLQCHRSRFRPGFREESKFNPCRHARPVRESIGVRSFAPCQMSLTLLEISIDGPPQTQCK
jgi:hypothetical protein